MDGAPRPLLKACLNGARTPDQHPALPVTAEQVTTDARRVAAAGAGALHVHVKDAAGRDTFDADRLAEVLRAVRAVSNVPVGVTTGAWAMPDPADRVRAVMGWTVLPDFASVNWHEDGAEEVAAALLARGVGVEAGLWHTDAAAAWRRSRLRDQCFRVLLELPDGLDERATVAAAAALRAAVEPLGAGQELLLHGEGSSCWPALRLGAAAGLATRVGLEDTLTLPDGSRAPDNAALVSAARRLVESGSGTPDPA